MDHYIMSHRYQITLPEDLLAELKREATRLRVPLAEFIRQTMKERLRRSTPDRVDNPLASITGLVDSDERDLASRVDEILYR